jgi:hypothetical protein
MLKIYIGILLALVFLAPSAFSQQAMQNVADLKNGSVVRGLTIEQMPNVSVKIQTRDGNALVYKMEDVLKITKELPVGVQGASVKGEKSPVLAFVLSSLVPSAGQYYNGDIAKGVIQVVLFAGGITLALGPGLKKEEYSNSDCLCIGFPDFETTEWFWVGLGTAGASYIWSIIDAPISAIRINKARGRYYGHLLEFNSDKQVIGFDLATNGKTIGAKLSMHF